MKKPNPQPLNPNTPRTKKVDITPLPRLYPETMSDDINTLDEVNKILDEISYEDNKQNNS